MSSSDFILIIVAFAPPAEWVESVIRRYPGIQIEIHEVDMYAKEMPTIPDETWAKTTVLFTWKLFPEKEKVPNLKYVQLLSAGCGQILDLPVFKDTDISFCTSNGVHP